jgi:hypothetical protein
LSARRCKHGRAAEGVDLIVTGEEDSWEDEEEDGRVRKERLQGSFATSCHVGITTWSKDVYVDTFGPR